MQPPERPRERARAARRAPAVLGAVLALSLAGLLVWRASATQAPAEAARPSPAAAPYPAPEATAPVSLAALPDSAERTALAESSAAGPATEARPPDAVASPDAPRAELHVRVVDGAGGAPLPGATVAVVDERAASGAPRGVVVDENGRARLAVPAGRALWLMGRGSDDDVGAAGMRVEPLFAGERREVELALPRGLDAVFHGRVVDPAGRPVRAAAVWLQRDLTVAERDASDTRVSASPERRSGSSIPRRSYQADVFDRTETDADGRFSLHFASWKGLHLRVEMEGYPLVVAWPEPGHETPATARTIALSEGARLEAHVVDASGAGVAGCVLRLSCQGHEMFASAAGEPVAPLGEVEWSATTDAAGSASITALPERLPLRVELWRDGRRVRADPERLVLEPGERRVREWRLGTGATLVGTLVDEAGAAIGRHEVWLVPCAGSARARRLLASEDQDELVARARSAADGRFRFDDVPAGTWWIGPEPEGAVVPLAERVELVEGAPAASVTIVVPGALAIEGTVVQSDGAPAPNVLLLASSSRIEGTATAWSDVDGAFRLAPLPPGDFQVRVLFAAAPGPARVVAAGTTDLEIVLAPPSSLEGVVVDDEGTGQLARVLVSRAAWEGMMETESPEGRFRFSGLEPGSYDLCAATDDGRVALLADVPVDAGADVRDVRLRLERGARVALRYEGAAELVQVLALAREVVVYANGLRAGLERELTAPPGAVRVRWRDATGTARERVLEVVAGERAELVLADG